MADHDTTHEWDAATIASQLPCFAAADLDDPAVHLAWLDALAAWGVARIDGVEPSYDGLRSIAQRIGVIHATNYGVEWDIVATEQPVTPVDSDLPLRVHTDLPYRDLPPGCQLLLSAIADAPGGETLLVDGYRLARELVDHHPETFATLTEVERTFAYIGDGQRYIGGGPVIGLDRDGRPAVIRHAPDLVLPMRADDPRVAAADDALRVFQEVAARPEMEHRIRLSPGQLLCIDNHRVLHGRGDVDLTRGGRRLLGCYLARDELASARRVARRAANA